MFNKQEKKEKITLDVSGMALGRAASKAALILRGKSKAAFSPNRESGVQIEVKNYGQLKISDKKMRQKIYKRYSGYPSGLKKTSLAELYRRNPKEVFLRAVKGMLPNNKLRRLILKNIIFA